MAFLEPFIIYGARRLTPGELAIVCNEWENLLITLRDDRIDPRKMLAKGYDLPANFKKGFA